MATDFVDTLGNQLIKIIISIVIYRILTNNDIMQLISVLLIASLASGIYQMYSNTGHEIVRISHICGEALFGLYTRNRRTYYRQMLRSLEAMRLGFRMIKSLWNSSGALAAVLPMHRSNLQTSG